MQLSINYSDWRKKVLQLQQYQTRKDALEFCQLVEQVAGINEISIIKTLFETFAPGCETSVQQTVVRILGTFDILLYYQAFLESLPRFVAEGNGWDIELGAYPERSPTGVEIAAIAKIVKNSLDQTKYLFLNVLKDDDFRSDHAWAESLIRAIEG